MKYSDNFRDSVATIDESGKRILIFPKKPEGRLYKLREYTTLVWLALFFSVPFIKINGHPFLLLDVVHRKFSIFGAVFWPQDFHLFALFFISLTLFLILFTVVYGRIFCGWACPQTIFLEMIYRKVEYWIEGTLAQQKALNRSPWTAKKIGKKLLKHLIFLGISFVLVHTILMYFVKPEDVFQIITTPPWEGNMKGFLFATAATLIFYGIYARFREQICTLVCPYGRLQGVLLDDRSIVISYDFKRGEPRGKGSRKKQTGLGDCIDCDQCVLVCPTGIDIRNGTQLECVNCTACIDACNKVMRKVGTPEGLIRYASYQGIANNEKLRFTPRIIGYTIVLSLLVGILAFSITTREPVEANILRVPGVLSQITENGEVSNLYNYKVVNKTYQSMDVSLRLKSPEGNIQMIGQLHSVAPESLSEGSFLVILPDIPRDSNKVNLEIEVWSGQQLIDTVKTSFVGKAQ